MLCSGSEPSNHTAAPFFGRLFISLIFVLSSLGKIFNFQETVSALESFGIKGGAIFIAIAILFELGGGLLVLLGWYTRLGVYALMIFLLPATLIFHAFWNHSDTERMVQMAMFLKNITIYGGLLLLLSYGPGKWSLDARCSTKAKT